MQKGRLAAAFVLVLLVVLAVQAQPRRADSHFSSASLSLICRDSAFVHGYLHGYQDAFHIANLRLYIPTLVFNPPKIDHQDEKAYHREFGDKKFFLAGYDFGFRSGYADGISQHKFRALDLLRDSLHLNQADLTDATNHDQLDRGLSQGYSAGREHGLRDGRLREPFRPDSSGCTPASSAPQSSGFCQGLQQGYRMGYIDGYQNQYDVAVGETASR
jgi:hypothetical protein